MKDKELKLEEVQGHTHWVEHQEVGVINWVKETCWIPLEVHNARTPIRKMKDKELKLEEVQGLTHCVEHQEVGVINWVKETSWIPLEVHNARTPIRLRTRRQMLQTCS